MTDQATTLTPIYHGPGEGEHLWAFGGLATIKADGDGTDGRVMVTEQLAPRGAGSPLHIHHREDEWFYVLDGELTFWVGGRTIVAPGGAFVYGPRDVPHTFVVSSEEARFLLVTAEAGFEGFMRDAGEPAQRVEIPPPPAEAPDIEAMTRVAASYGIDIIGPPGIPS
jgi:quercetin dioxygenase-like cupin family protein